MQVTRPNKIRSPGVKLHPKACAALGLEAECATPNRLGTPVPRTCMHTLGTGHARKSGEPLGFRPKEGTCASTGAHPPGETSTSRWRQSALLLLPGPLCWGPTVRSSGMWAASPLQARRLFLSVTGATPGATMGRLSTTECTYLPTSRRYLPTYLKAGFKRKLSELIPHRSVLEEQREGETNRNVRRRLETMQ